MEAEFEGKALELDHQEVEKISEIDIDALVNDCVNVEQDCFLGENNFNEFRLKLRQQIEGKYQELKNKILEIISNRAMQERNACINQGKSQISQRQAELTAQFQQEIRQNFLAGRIALCTSGIEQMNNALLSYQTTVQQEFDEKLNHMCNTTLSTVNQKSDEVLKWLNTRVCELTIELTEMYNQGNYIKVEAIEEYNKGWLQELDRRIEAIANDSLDQMGQRSISFDYKTFKQFVEESGRKEEILHNNQIKSLGNKCKREHYVLSIGDLEKLLDIIDEPRCIKERNNIQELICKSVINGTQLSQVMFNKLEHLLDQKEYVQSVVSILAEDSKKMQKIPESILIKLSGIAGTKDYAVDVWNKVNLIVVTSLLGEAELPESVLTNLIDNNFVLKIYTDDTALQVATIFYLYFIKHPRSLEKYGDKIIDIIVDDTLNM